MWQTFAMAVLLSLFLGGTWIFLTYTARSRADQALTELTRAFEDAWTRERAERGDQPGDTGEAAADAALGFRYQERRVFVFDAAGRLLAVSDTAPLAPALTMDALTAPGRGLLWDLVAGARLEGAYTATLEGGSDDEVPVRALARRVEMFGAPFTVVGLRSLGAEEEAAEAFIEVLTFTVPLALILAAISGYWFTRASLAPAAAMGRSAARIGGSGTLHERLPVLTPDDELGELATAFNGLLARVENAFWQQERSAEQQRQFMADASHELRTPVTALTTVADVALARPDRDPAELLEALDVVRDEGLRLGRIVEDLFLLARADAGQLPVRAEPLYLEEVVTASARAATSIAAARGVRLDAPLADEAPFVGDPYLLHRLLMNLLDNAIKYTPSGGSVRLTLGTRAAAADGASAYVISVEDTGDGIASNAWPHLFERFYRADRSRTRQSSALHAAGRVEEEGRPGGAGLGLSIARWIAEAHGGTVLLAASGPDGSRFEVILPLSPPAFAGAGLRPPAAPLDSSDERA